MCRAPDPAAYRPLGSPPPETKRCTRCQEEKPIAEFTYPSGTRSRCKACLNEIGKEKRNLDLDGARAADRARRASNPDGIRASRRKHYHANKAYYAAKSTAWVKDNPEANRARRARYRARKLTAPGGGVSLAEWITLRDSYGCCVSCLRTDGPLEPDHVLPLALGGRDHIDNIQPLCRSCNASKKDRHIDYRVGHTSWLLREPAFTTI
ncbi:HNH endonuclease [Streptomyces sp. Root369]|uniref:HNH endonuclease n=1 Tax=Streptomyces sp. Root369 TaxID=1736523 RepID=UPI001300FCF6|nr:HNH endonuclease [Streptomyces sp. Root369]